MKEKHVDIMRTLLRKEMVAIQIRLDGVIEAALRNAYLADLATMEEVLKALDKAENQLEADAGSCFGRYSRAVCNLTSLSGKSGRRNQHELLRKRYKKRKFALRYHNVRHLYRREMPVLRDEGGRGGGKREKLSKASDVAERDAGVDFWRVLRQENAVE